MTFSPRSYFLHFRVLKTVRLFYICQIDIYTFLVMINPLKEPFFFLEIKLYEDVFDFIVLYYIHQQKFILYIQLDVSKNP